ncbi:alpha/beta hydrolase [Nocardia anaemiae]|uniref:alpha/beta hydrolase n=1 Tax=Nocardia anaemiae TaxID=263910 RepID=UPI0007A4B3E3|nr:alpha/beta hydrolase [Nocardia anaemiae]
MGDRLEVRFPSGPAGVECGAWLYLPAGGPAPIIVMAHGLGGIREMRLDAYAERFRAAGYACLVFDYRHFGASDGTPRQLIDIREQLADWAAAIAFARSLNVVDTSRIVLWGTSFGGGHVLVAAAGDGDIAAVVAQCPFTDGFASVLAMQPSNALRVTARAARDLIGAYVGREPVMITTAGRPGSTALMASPDSEPGYLALVPNSAPFANEVAARVALSITLHIPGRSAAKVSCPIMFAICELDAVAPAKATLRHARKAPRGEIALYPAGHFDIYVGDWFERVVADQIAFLHAHVAPRITVEESER